MLEAIPNIIIHRSPDEPITDQTKVHLWFTDLDKQETEMPGLSLLSPSEQARASRLKSPLEQRRYITSHVFTRRVLSNLTGIAPGSLEFNKDKCGKSLLNRQAEAGNVPSRLLRFNISHSENILGIAVGMGFEVGIDVEVVNKSLDFLEIAQASLEQPDVEQVQSSPVSERAPVFYRLWTSREAFAKMQGHGVASNHVSNPSALASSMRFLEFAIGERKIVCSIALATQQP